MKLQSQSIDQSKPEQNGTEKYPRPVTRGSGLQSSFLCLVICAVLITFLLGENANEIMQTDFDHTIHLIYSFIIFKFGNLFLFFSHAMMTGSYTDTLHPIVDKIALTLGYKQLQYAVVIDAGSTGSRVIAYEFHIGYLDSRLVLDKELFVQVKPGLSFYHDKPTEVLENDTISLTHVGQIYVKI